MELVVWPYDPAEDSAAASGMYTNLGEMELFSEDGPMQWSGTFPCPIAAARIALVEHSIPYTTPQDYEGTVTNSASGGSVQMRFHSSGIYGLKIEFVDPAVPPVVIKFLADSDRQTTPFDDCNATKSFWHKELEILPTRYGMFVGRHGDKADDHSYAHLDQLKIALKVDTLETAETIDEAETKIAAYAATQQNNLPFSMSFAGHGNPSSYKEYRDENGRAEVFGQTFKGKIWHVKFLGCCVAMGYPRPQHDEGNKHLLSTIADGLSDFANASRASSAGPRSLIYFDHWSFFRPPNYVVPRSDPGDLLQVNGMPLRSTRRIELPNPQAGGNMTFTYTFRNEINPPPANCVNITTTDPAHGVMDWHDNVLCGPADQQLGLQFSTSGSVAGKRCTKVEEPSDPDWGNNSYICVNDVPQNPLITFEIRKPANVEKCLQILEPSEPGAHTWLDNWMCFSFPAVQAGRTAGVRR